VTEAKIEPLEAAFDFAIGERIRADEDFAAEAWAALCNTDWIDPYGRPHSESFRSAGALISRIRGSGDYTDWYCSGQAGYVSPDIEAAMKLIGWSFKPITWPPKDRP
jgi:hypothetical protein